MSEVTETLALLDDLTQALDVKILFHFVFIFLVIFFGTPI